VPAGKVRNVDGVQCRLRRPYRIWHELKEWIDHWAGYERVLRGPRGRARRAELFKGRTQGLHPRYMVSDPII
jgi:hypothetical protein